MPNVEGDGASDPGRSTTPVAAPAAWTTIA
jgi:hypothetical protein